jgi:SAM-dependent methyltransferase
MGMTSLPEGLDQRFLKFIGSNEESERKVHSFYLKFFQPDQIVLDLGCGAGYFVKMLCEQKVKARGIDMDALALAEAQALGAPVIQANVLDYLKELPKETIDAIFCAHLVEHLEVESVYELMGQAYRVLKPEGFMVVVTPNVRSYVSHLEMFWLHFDHKRFYHPRLLEFFMKECHFDRIIQGENTSEQGLASPSKIQVNLGSADILNWDKVIPPPRLPLLHPWWLFKKWLARLIVLPYLHETVKAFIPVEYANRPFEVYVVGYK